MTPTQLYDYVRNSAFDVSEELSSESELYMYMSQAENIFAKKCNCTQAIMTDTTIALQKEYVRPDALKIERLTYDSVKLKKIDLRQVDEIEGTSYGGVTTSGNPVYYYEFGNIIGLSPTPAEAKILKYYVYAEPTDLSASSTDFTIPQEYAHVLANYCLYKMFFKDQQLSEADRYLKQWQAELEEASNDFITADDMDRIPQVKLEECMPGTDLGAI